ncbi:uncharacterized protein ARMOST_19384 [Armillaria ostoyae]|uniref:Catalase core domain-containing protein n=1 Tax=Armillaria ostoyae TaxID=47428 RepID=A0A284S4I0_ARMOS|nr:uncharacterized protein ARMOST_19384 [Armillaria ostoyae]
MRSTEHHTRFYKMYLSCAAVTETTFAASNGASIAQPYAWSQAGPSGPLLLQDFASIDLLTHFDRERIPERIVHAKAMSHTSLSALQLDSGMLND